MYYWYLFEWRRSTSSVVQFYHSVRSQYRWQGGICRTADKATLNLAQGCGSGQMRTFLIGPGAGKFSPDPDPIGTLAK